MSQPTKNTKAQRLRFTSFSKLIEKGLEHSLVKTGQFFSERMYRTPYSKSEIIKK